MLTTRTRLSSLSLPVLYVFVTVSDTLTAFSVILGRREGSVVVKLERNTSLLIQFATQGCCFVLLNNFNVSKLILVITL